MHKSVCCIRVSSDHVRHPRRWEGPSQLGLKLGEEVNQHPVMQEDFEPLPITPDFYRCQLGDFEAGSYNVSVQLPHGLAFTNPDIDTGLFARDANGEKYEVQYFPIITSISPRYGSFAGGTILTINGHGFSMDETDIEITFGGNRNLGCRVLSSTLEQIQCETVPNYGPGTLNCSTGPGLMDCASCSEVLTKMNECASCNTGSILLTGQCHPTAWATISVDDTDAELAPGMARFSHAAASGGSFVSDEGRLGKGRAWIVFSPSIAVSMLYRVRLTVPNDAAAAGCAPRATNVSVIVYHSASAHPTVVAANLLTTSGLSIDVGVFLFSAPTKARVVIDNTFSHGCLAVDGLTLTPESLPSSDGGGCNLSTAANYDADATSDGSCLFVGNRGLLRQTWSFLGPLQEDIATSSPAHQAKKVQHVARACPRPDEEAGWDFLQNLSNASAVTATDCLNGACPSHDACPADSFCCLHSAHARCAPNVGSFTVADTTDGWKLVFRQTLPEIDVQGGYFRKGQLSKNPNKPTAAMYSILDQLDQYKGDDGMFEFKLRYRNSGDIHWKQESVSERFLPVR